ncbi:MAG TPA: carboxypeptidase regulatory-like domain-containing protein [Pyrinomonadaceae bacterium]|nr:carboxypeptidase regulatory-like domain-containing protein [Pyrinomonadaceae bacterium]
MKSYFRLFVLLSMASLTAIVLVAYAFFSTREQPTAKIQKQAPTVAASSAVGTAPAPLLAPLPNASKESQPVAARRNADKKPLFPALAASPRRVEGVESNIRDVATHKADDVLEANSATSEDDDSPILSNAKDLRGRALKGQDNQETAQKNIALSDVQKVTDRKPIESRLKRAGKSFTGDLRSLPYEKSVEREMPEHDDPYTVRSFIGTPAAEGSETNAPAIAVPAAPAPTPLNVFEGLDRFGFGAGSPPDTNGDAGPNNYIQTVNTSIGIYNKTTGVRDAGFTFNTFMSQGNFGNLCDTNNFGDPVVLYDSFEDRWIITDFAFVLDGGGNVLAPAFQCFAASKTGDPLVGGWNFYSIQLNDFLGDYPKFGIWPDGLYMSANMFGFGAGGSFATARAWAFNKAQMYAGAPSVQSVFFNVGGGDFTVIPSNARLQTGTPPAGTPNFFLSSWLFTNALTVYKFHVDWDRISLTTFTGPDVPIAATSWPNAAVGNAAQPGTATLLDVLQIRAMVQNQYTNFGGVESLWVPHTVRRGDTSGLAAPRWYQVTVTGGTVNGAIPQATTWDPDGANVVNRFMPSLALDRAGNMALGYSTSNSTTEFPSIKYAGRLSTDPVNTFSLTEQVFFTGTASQTGTTRWGDYSGMTLDPNGCTFWYTTEYANPADQTFDHRWLTKFGSFQFSPCTTVGNGTLQGTVTTSPGGLPILGATVALGARTTTTNVLGQYSFTIPAGTYLTEAASKPGLNSSTTTNIVVADGGTTVKDFALTSAPVSACLVDTTTPDFQLGVFSNLDVTTTPGNVTLAGSPIDQSSTGGTTTGTSITATNWGGQTFTAGVTGTLVQADTIQLFCNACTGTTPNLTVSIRNTSGGLPTGADLTTATIPGFSTGTNSFTVTFAPSIGLTSGTVYALLVRPVANPSLGTGYFWIRSSPGTYANGQRVTTANSGGTWAADSTRDFNFRTIMQQATFAASGDIASGVKDSNPAPPSVTRWNTLSWTATVPANTTLRFQIAGSNNLGGPFNFIGPDGTAGTFFTTSPSTIYNLVNGNRYLKYKAFFTTTDTAVTPTVTDVTVCYNQGPTATNGIITGRITDPGGAAVSGAVVNLAGSQSRETITDANGNYLFDNVETNGFYTVTPTLVNYHFGPENRSFSLLGNRTDAGFTATRDAVVTGNAIDTPEYFVRQHYLDFLGREPDESGFNFWTDQITSCGSDAACIERRTINVSAAYFLSIEHQNTGGLVNGLYRASYGRAPSFAEFMPDTATVAQGVIVGTMPNWQEVLLANKEAFVAAWVQRPAFQAAYGGLANGDFVDALISHTGGSFNGDREALVNGLNAGTLTRAAALQQIAENDGFVSAKRNENFVRMQYFGYLRRDPDAAGEAFWLNKLNQFNGNFEQAEMVKAFLVSSEYRGRFNQ